ncbi:hypothetical protein CYMTET_30894 [Cymbomonas tetramitiformis]|uniref:Fe2OG dioxygenase domain-containing protein n=1 Tax=Cymbomonas tetramitiformis TaxID=36881 RepID=A0AAE0KTH5_9CHLO|nr:hypothetical protein CYMTET_30894 [Cymbomonas tetramitiformis]
MKEEAAALVPSGRKFGSISTVTLILAAVAVFCSICMVVVAFSPNLSGRLAEQTEKSQESPKEVDASGLGSALNLLATRLVDPDGTSQELEDPAILIDPDSLEPEKGAKIEDLEESESTPAAQSPVTRRPRSDSARLNRNVSATGGKSDCTITKELLAYTVNRIQSTKLSMDPYPHIYISGIFEPQFYNDCILKKLPKTDTYESLPNNRDRKLIPFTGKWGSGPRGMNRVGRPQGKFPEEKAAKLDVDFWTKFGETFGGSEMVRSWVDKFHPTLQHRRNMADRVGPAQKVSPSLIEKKFWYTLSLGRDIKGYNIGPHTDTSDKWVTTLYYLPSDEKQKDLGTVIVRSKSGKVARGNVRGKIGGDFVIAKRAAFVPNAVLAFAACEGSWHAVQKVQITNPRDTIQGFVNSAMGGGKSQCGGALWDKKAAAYKVPAKASRSRDSESQEESAENSQDEAENEQTAAAEQADFVASDE